MAARGTQIDDRLNRYISDHALREVPVLARLREETAGMKESMMQVAPEQGQFMALLVELIRAHRTLEVGTFTGYSALAVALALPPEGQVVTCDISEDFTAMGRRYWEEAGVADKIDLRIGPAAATLEGMLSEGAATTFDFAFIDADKVNYDAYYEFALKLVRSSGLIAIDNVLWNGAVADPARDDEETLAIRALNAKIHQDERVTTSLVPIGDGLTLARKR